MCGISGVAGWEGAGAERSVRLMNSALARRGPDAEDVTQFSGAVLGHRRLSIFDLSDAGKQPMTTPDGAITVIADRFDGKPLNSPNDLVCKSDGSIWFTDPPFGIGGHWEGDKATPELPHSVYRISPDGKLSLVTDKLAGPNGLAFSPDEKKLYIAESRATPNRVIAAFDVGADGSISNRTVIVDANGPGSIDGFRVDTDGNLWCGWGSNGSPTAKAEELDGVMVFNPAGKAIGFIRLPERCANLTFGGPKNNRLYMASCHSLYALYVEAVGAA